MTTGMALALVILAVLAASLFYIVRAEGGIDAIPRLIERAGVPSDFLNQYFTPEADSAPIPTRSPASRGSTVPAEFQSGASRYSQGSCTTAADCVTGGCSGEVCGNSSDAITTCEYSDSFPNAQGYSCTCLPKGVCGWQ